VRQLLCRILKATAAIACGSLIVLIASLLAIRVTTSGVSFWLVLGIVSIGLTWLLKWAIVSVGRIAGKHWNMLRPAQNATLVIISTITVLAAAEGLLTVLERRAPLDHPKKPERVMPPSATATVATVWTEAALIHTLEEYGARVPLGGLVERAIWRHSLLTMPPEWERSATETNGEIRSYRWHGALHIFDRNGMRRMTPFPPKLEDRCRILVVGDSLTYGTGIDEAQTYAATAERLLEQHYRVEFLNLGVGGANSEDVLDSIRRFMPELHPDLVVYGVCHNDFLPSGVGMLTAEHAYAFPLLKSLKHALMRHSRIMRLTSDAYHTALLRLGLRADFYDQILANFRDYQGRFARDVKLMNDEVVAQGLPPITAIVLDQFPAPRSRGHRITEVAESALQSARMRVIATDSYYRHFAGANFWISKWEGHPNEIAHAIWATMICAELEGRSELARFRKEQEIKEQASRSP
jgi:lysophospholipase L1-like esterase